MKSVMDLLRVGTKLWREPVRKRRSRAPFRVGGEAHMGMKMSFTKKPMKPNTAKPSAVRSEILVNSAVPQTIPHDHQDLINHGIRWTSTAGAQTALS